MIDRSSWIDLIAPAVKSAWLGEESPPRARQLCRVEIGLYALDRLCPGQPAKAGWTLFSGYPYALVGADSAERERALRILRHLGWSMRRPYAWDACLEKYRDYPERVRGFELGSLSEPPKRLDPAAANHRWKVYESVLVDTPKRHLRPGLKQAEEGRTYRFPLRNGTGHVRIPEKFPAYSAQGYDLEAIDRRRPGPVEVVRGELLETADWMDRELGPSRGKTWVERVESINFDVLTQDGQEYVERQWLTIDGMFHLAGMVGAGKSTFRDVLTVRLAKQRRRVTLVVGDIAEQLKLVALFTDLGIKAAPVLGASTRVRNTQRMHRRLATAKAPTLLAHDPTRFTYLSTACPLDALRSMEGSEPLLFSEAPCSHLRAVETKEPPVPVFGRAGRAAAAQPRGDEEETGPDRSCPLWAKCPRHQAAHSLVDADVWVANPASLVYSLVPRQQNRERIRLLELAAARSDLIVVDEADQVQMQLDALFAPSATLVGRAPDSWLDDLYSHTIDELARRARLQLSKSTVDDWTSALNTVSAAADRLYARLLRHSDLRAWVQADYFSTWTLQQKLVNNWFGNPGGADPESEEESEESEEPADAVEEEPAEAAGEGAPESAGKTAGSARERLFDLFEQFREDPLGANTTNDPQLAELVGITQDLLHGLAESAVHHRITPLLRTLSGRPSLEEITADLQAAGRRLDAAEERRLDEELKPEIRRFEFTLLLAALQERLDAVTDQWVTVEDELNLESASNHLAKRPPIDYGPVVPESPMGNILGFQFLPEDLDDAGSGSGALRFFRCTGVGRILLSELIESAAPIDGPCPNVLLMSGTSWAGTAPGAHVRAPVRAILRTPKREHANVLTSVFRTHFVHGLDGKALHLSGTRPEERPKMLELMLRQLAAPVEGRRTSVFDEEIRLIGDHQRKRLLLLVGSYDEARRAAALIHKMPQWQGKVCQLIADDAELEPWSYGGPPEQDSDEDHGPAVLRRGEVATFGETGAQILVAPLMSVERGHNILNDAGKAAIGSVFFLARPHPRPHDLNLAVQKINRWVEEQLDIGGTTSGSEFARLVGASADLDEAGRAFRRLGRIEWRTLLTRQAAWSRLDDEEKAAFTWDRMVIMWQVIGRLVRGAVPARVVFVDSKFAEREAAGRGRDTHRTGLLASMLHVLAPYFDRTSGIARRDRQLVEALYGPLHKALAEMLDNGTTAAGPAAVRRQGGDQRW
ncbi:MULTISPECIES: hypothetical protein [Kitasatospora]|uniref:pPIWI-RE three-gene island domain-containing protein n=1 Tax=Kitasatospora setae (strain ATCC 33774 / DSM 43861 / JCM 3304 / KCC A-0304 / NBRC 14216 / KM-6054) TaxID=452652 RepID=E4N107_KITSK|nr:MULTISPECIES: hypothetical protein [Kitasatospora]BAJ31841.1 hypothetical protein KSE_60750 [Kitasatospora setae KM-6054]